MFSYNPKGDSVAGHPRSTCRVIDVDALRPVVDFHHELPEEVVAEETIHRSPFDLREGGVDRQYLDVAAGQRQPRKRQRDIPGNPAGQAPLTRAAHLLIPGG